MGPALPASGERKKAETAAPLPPLTRLSLSVFPSIVALFLEEGVAVPAEQAARSTNASCARAVPGLAWPTARSSYPNQSAGEGPQCPLREQWATFALLPL